MSKTVVSVLTVAAAIAVQAIPGVGQAIGAALVTAITSAGIAAGLSLVASALQKAPKADTTETALKTERPPRISAYGRLKLFGAYILYETASDGSAVDVWAFHEGRIDAIEGYYLGDKAVTLIAGGFVSKGPDGSYGDSVIRVGANLGAATETVHAQVAAKLPSIWTAAHRGDGVVTGFMISKPVKAKIYQEVYSTGGPNQTPLALVIRAQPVFDWRDETQSLDDPLTWKWSENVWLHIAHYQLVRNGKTWARHFAPTLAYWTAAADDADLPSPLKGGGTEPRYRSCVSHRHAGNGAEHKAVLAALLACGDGWMAPREDGALVVHAGRYYPPTVHIGPDLVVSYSIEDGIEDENALNQINVTYVSAEHDFNTVDTDPWTNEADILARGAVRSDNLENQVPSASQARRLAKRKERQAMAGKRGTVTTLAAGAVMLSERFIHLTLAEGVGTEDEFVAVDAPVEITTLSRNLQTGAVTASWILADPTIDEWDADDEEGLPAPVGEGVPRDPLDAPTIDDAEPLFDGDILRLSLSVTGPDRDDLTWFVRWRIVGADAWGSDAQYTDTDAGPGVVLVTNPVPLDADVEVQAAYQVGDGRVSPWSESAEIDTAGTDLEYDGGDASGGA